MGCRGDRVGWVGWYAGTLAVALAVVAMLSRPAVADEAYEPVLTDDGLLTQPWFLQSFLDLNEDLDEAATAGKRFAIIWELRGCPYCKQMHLVNFARPAIRTYVRENFDVLQLNIIGSRRVTDFDGEELEERKLARKYGVVFTPTIQFFPVTSAAVEGSAGRDVEVARMPGYFRPFHFLAMFEFVREEGYMDRDFAPWLEERLARARAEGVDVESW